MTDIEAFHTLSYYTISQDRKYFIHQLAVDAFGAQHANSQSKAMKIMFTVGGLYLFNVHGYSGKQVQDMHITMAKANRSNVWPRLSIPTESAKITVHDVLAVPDNEKEPMIKKWNTAVWNTWKSQQENIEEIFATYVGFDIQ